MMLVFGDGVRIGVWTTEISVAHYWASVGSLRLGFDVYVVSIEDKKHGASSLHPYGLAVDFGVAANDRSKLEKLFSWLTRTLPTTYDVIFEGDHVHVEYDLHRTIRDATAPSIA